MKIVPYNPKYRKDFVEMNLAWISSMFKVEPEDERELSSVETAIAAGAEIFFAVDDSDNVMACCMVAPRDSGEWEIMKFAAKGMYTGTGAGSACLKAVASTPAKNKQKTLFSFPTAGAHTQFTCTKNSALQKSPSTRKNSPTTVATSPLK